MGKVTAQTLDGVASLYCGKAIRIAWVCLGCGCYYVVCCGLWAVPLARVGLIVTRHHPTQKPPLFTSPTQKNKEQPRYASRTTSTDKRVHQTNMARGKGQQTSGGTKKEKKETRQERRARLEAEAAAREVSEIAFRVCAMM